MVGFAGSLLEKIDEEYTQVYGADELKDYTVTAQVIRDSSLNPKKVLVITKNCLQKLGQWDNPHAIVLAKHIESLYNQRVMQGY